MSLREARTDDVARLREQMLLASTGSLAEYQAMLEEEVERRDRAAVDSVGQVATDNGYQATGGGPNGPALYY